VTRDNIKRAIAGDPEAERITDKHNSAIVDKVFNYFEARIAELESNKTCAGCIHYYIDTSPICMQCNRNWADLYELRET
jgi:hypothetical protein